MSTADPEGPPDDEAPAPRPPAPAPFVLSCALGAAGLVLLLAGAATATTALSLAGVVSGTLSLGAALYWRSLLITAWHAQTGARPGRGAPPARPGGAPPGPG